MSGIRIKWAPRTMVTVSEGHVDLDARELWTYRINGNWDVYRCEGSENVDGRHTWIAGKYLRTEWHS